MLNIVSSVHAKFTSLVGASGLSEEHVTRTKNDPEPTAGLCLWSEEVSRAVLLEFERVGCMYKRLEAPIYGGESGRSAQTCIG